MKVLLTGGRGMVGQAIRRLAPGDAPGWEIAAPGREELNLLDPASVNNFFKGKKFDLVIHAAAKVGGIKANMADPTGFLADNLLMNTHIIEEARLAGVPKFIFLGSSCMYPRDFDRPLVEEDILTAPLEPTNEGYAIAKIAGARHCAYISQQYGLAYRTFIPCNLYGPGDHFDLQRGHLIAAALTKVHNALVAKQPSVEIWGDGLARREFMYVDDLARFLFTSADKLKDMPPCLNTGLGRDYTVNEYYEAIADALQYKGGFTHNLNAPTGMKRKLADSSRAKQFGWDAPTSLREGLQKTYHDFLKRTDA